MSKVYCPNCGSEVRLPERSSVGIGMTISKETKGDFALPLETVNNNNVKKEENKTMRNNNNMNGFDMEMLAKMVAAQLSGQNVQTQTVVQNAPKVDVTKLDDSDMVDKNHWAENSKFYGKEICGYAYNPYMIRRFLPSQFNQLIEKYNGNVHKGITEEYTYMYTVCYTLEEVRKLAMLEKRDKIAFDERKYIFTLDKCRKIFTEYVEEVIAHLTHEANEFVAHNKVGKEYKQGIKGFKWMTVGVVAEKIVNHKVVKYMEYTEEFNCVLAYYENLKDNIRWSWTYKKLYETMFTNKKHMVKVPVDTRKSKVFMDCFIKAGAYYTLKQQLMFDENIRFRAMSGRMAVMELRRILERGTEGYVIYAMLKDVNRIR